MWNTIMKGDRIMRTVTRILASLCILGLLFSTAATAAEKSRADVLDAACERLVKVMNR